MIYVYSSSLLLAICLTPAILRLGRRMKVMDGPNARKVHSSPVPRIGGAAIFLSAVIPPVVFLSGDHSGLMRAGMGSRLSVLLGCSAFIFLVGLIDDIRGLRAGYKLFAQTAAAAALTAAGVRIETLNVLNLFVVNLGPMSYPVTIFWIVAVTNAVNLIDGLDGLAAGISAIACAAIAVFAFWYGQPAMGVIMLALLGSLSGFLFFNFSPARIFMGDCGSMFLGFLLASSSVMCAVKSGTFVAVALPALALGLAMFDTFFAMIRRYLGRWGIMSPDRSHLHHRLLSLGLRQRHVVITMYLITAIMTGFGIFMMISRGIGPVVIFVCEIVLLVLIFRAAGAVGLREFIAGLRRHKAIARQIARDVGIFENTHLRFAGSVSFGRWWRAITEAAEKSGFLELSVQVTAEGGRRHSFVWMSRGNGIRKSEEVMITVPINRRRFNMPVEVSARIAVDGLLESAGRRIMLLGRLIDEYSVARPVEDEAGGGDDKQPLSAPGLEYADV